MNLRKFAAYAFAIAAMATFAACSSDNDSKEDEPTPPTPPEVPEEVKVESVTVTPTELTLEIEQTSAITAVVLPEEAKATVVWTSSDEAVATVAEDGTVTAVAAGQATITATAEEKSASCQVTVNAPVPAPEVGNFYYSDGTWSAEVDNTKSIIGIVFWTGDPTVTDPALKKDHPDCVHGLVVSIDQEQNPVPWQENYEAYGKCVFEWVEANATEFESPKSNTDLDAPLQKIKGYNNTKAIEAFNAAEENAQWPVEAVAKVVEYRSMVPAPRNSSDWFLPSAKELSLLCAGEIEGDIRLQDPICTMLNIINPILESIDGAPISKHSFWTSTEAYDDNRPIVRETAWNYCFHPEYKVPLSHSLKSWSENARVRYVLAF